MVGIACRVSTTDKRRWLCERCFSLVVCSCQATWQHTNVVPTHSQGRLQWHRQLPALPPCLAWAACPAVDAVRV